MAGDVWQGWGVHGRVAYMIQGHMRGGGGGHSWQGTCVAGEMTTAAGGAHPTEMHSFQRVFVAGYWSRLGLGVERDRYEWDETRRQKSRYPKYST